MSNKYEWCGGGDTVAGYGSFNEGQDVSHLPDRVLDYLLACKKVKEVRVGKSKSIVTNLEVQ